MLAVGFGEVLIGALIILISILLIGLVLLQKNRGSGLSGAFGGVGGHSAFGTKTGDFLTWFTVSLAAIFLILCIVGNFLFEPDKTASAATPANAKLIDTSNANGNTSATDSSGEDTSGDNGESSTDSTPVSGDASGGDKTPGTSE